MNSVASVSRLKEKLNSSYNKLSVVITRKPS